MRIHSMLSKALATIAITTILSACGGGDMPQSPETPSAKNAGTTPTVRILSVAPDPVVNLQGAISVLKLIVGLDINPNGAPITAYQAYAADYDGNGKVELSDAIGILKQIVGLNSPQWVLIDPLSTNLAASGNLSPGIAPVLAATITQNVTAILRGDLTGGSVRSITYAEGMALIATTNRGSGGAGQTYNISGVVSGLSAGSKVTLLNNIGNTTTVAANGSFSFSTPVVYNGSYAVTVGTQPIGQTCTVSNGIGSGVVANVSGVSVNCSNITFGVSGVVNGLGAGNKVFIQNNGEILSAVASNGIFSFGVPVAYNGSYAVTIGTQPSGQICTVSNGSGAGVVANVNGVIVTCSDITYKVSGVVNGLNSGNQVTLQNNAGNSTTYAINGSFTFNIPIAYNGSYAITVGTQPIGQTCTVSNGSGAGVVADVNGVSVNCSDVTYKVSGIVNGLRLGNKVTLQNNASNATTVAANGSFSFNVPVVYNGSYAITVGTQPIGQTCTVSNGSGAGVVANVNGVSVTCSDVTYKVSGVVSGLATANQVTLQNNAGDATTVAANGSFSFGIPAVYNGSYAVTVGTQPKGQTCTVSNGTGAGVVAGVSQVRVICSDVTYKVSGVVSGLKSGNQVTLQNNAGNSTTVTVNGSFSFSIPVVYNGSYSVEVGTQPIGQTCTVSNGSGAGIGENVSEVVVSCGDITYKVSGVVSGLVVGGQLTLQNFADLQNNAGSATTVFANGEFSFITPVVYNGSYAVTVGTQPIGQTCTVSNGIGSGVVANANGITVSCSDITYKISGVVSGLSAGSKVTLLNNIGNTTTVAANGSFSFSTPVVYNGSYAVTVGTQPIGQTCTVSNGIGSGVVANVSGVSVNCISPQYTIGGTIIGLDDGESVYLDFVSGVGGMVFTSNGTFSYLKIGYNVRYATTVNTNPAGKICTIFNGTGVVTANVTDIMVICKGYVGAPIVSTHVGSAQQGSMDGTGASASFNNPRGIAIDIAGNLYVADTGNHKIRKITPDGVVSTLAGTGAPGNSNGAGSVATFNFPTGVAVDVVGNVYVADSENKLIRKVTPQGNVSTLAGSGIWGRTDGAGTAASFQTPWSVAVDRTGKVYVADFANISGIHTNIRLISTDGVVTTMFFLGNNYSSPYWVPESFSIDAAGVIYIGAESHVTTTIDLNGNIGTLLSIQNTKVGLSQGRYIAVDAARNLYGTGDSSWITKLTSNGVVSKLDVPGGAYKGIVIDAGGNLYVGIDNRILKIKL